METTDGPRRLTGLREVEDSFNVLFCDVWGVLHNGITVFPEAARALSRFRERCGPVILVTNSPRPAESAHGQLKGLGCPEGVYDAVASSGEATRAELSAVSDQPIFHIGPERDKPLFEGLDLSFVETPEEARVLAATGLFDDESESPEHYRPMLQRAAARDVLMVCANPDEAARRGDRIIACAGALASIYVELGGQVRLSGKPHAPIYDLARTHAEGRLGSESPRILTIGDSPDNDLEGARRQNLPAVFITAGLFEEELAGMDVTAWLSARGHRPWAVMDRLAW